MHSSRMRTARSLTVSHRKNHACPPPQKHACLPRKTTHSPPSNHTRPLEQPCMPPQSNHTCPPLEQPCMPHQSNHACLPHEPHMLPPPPGATMHAPPKQPHMPPPMDRMTDTCKNITFANFVCGR